MLRRNGPIPRFLENLRRVDMEEPGCCNAEYRETRKANMSHSRRMPGATLICSVALLPASAALAQDAALPAPQPVLPYDLSVASMGVSERYRPEYEPDGVSV